jgi:hypothetical protein
VKRARTEARIHGINNHVEPQPCRPIAKLAHPEHVEQLAGAVPLNVGPVAPLEALPVRVELGEGVGGLELFELGPEVVLGGYDGQAGGGAEGLGGSVERREDVDGDEGCS